MQLIEPGAHVLDPDNALGTLTTILARGTRAHEQLQRYDAARAPGSLHRDALRDVVDWLLEATVVEPL